MRAKSSGHRPKIGSLLTCRDGDPGAMLRDCSHGRLLEPGAYPDTKFDSCRNRQHPGVSGAVETSGPAQSNTGTDSLRGVDQAIDGGGGSHGRHHCGDRNQRESRRSQEHANRVRKVLPAGIPTRKLSAVCSARCSAISPSERRSSPLPVAWLKKRATKSQEFHARSSALTAMNRATMAAVCSQSPVSVCNCLRPALVRL